MSSGIVWIWRHTNLSSLGITRASIVDCDRCSPLKQGKAEKEVRKKWAFRTEQLVSWMHQRTNSMPLYHCLDQKAKLTTISNSLQVWTNNILSVLQLKPGTVTIPTKHRSQTNLIYFWCLPFALKIKATSLSSTTEKSRCFHTRNYKIIRSCTFVILHVMLVKLDLWTYRK